MVPYTRLQDRPPNDYLEWSSGSKIYGQTSQFDIKHPQKTKNKQRKTNQKKRTDKVDNENYLKLKRNQKQLRSSGYFDEHDPFHSTASKKQTVHQLQSASSAFSIKEKNRNTLSVIIDQIGKIAHCQTDG